MGKRTSKTKLLLLIESLVGGGAEKVLVTLLRNIDRSKFDITLCSVSETGVYLEEVRSLCKFKALLPDPTLLSGWHLCLYRIKYNLIYSWLPVGCVYRFFLPKGNDVEVAFLEGNPTRILSGSTNRRAKKIAWVHCDMSKIGDLSKTQDSPEKLLSWYNAYDRIVLVSESAKKGFVNRFPEISVPLSVIYNPLDIERILRLSKENSDIPEKNGKTRIISVGRLSPEKGYERLIRIAGRLFREGFPLELWIVGEGPLHHALASIIKREGLESIVTLWGFQANPYRFMSASDLYVSASLTEGYGLAIAEAVVLGIPFVATSFPGVEQMGKGSCGIIARNDEESLYRCIKSVLTDDSRLAFLKAEARKCGKDFDLLETMAKIEELFLE